MTSENFTCSLIFNTGEQIFKHFKWWHRHRQHASVRKWIKWTWSILQSVNQCQCSDKHLHIICYLQRILRYEGRSWNHILLMRGVFTPEQLPDEGLLEKKGFLFPDVSLYTSSPVVDFGEHTCKACPTVEQFHTQNANCDRPEETEHDLFLQMTTGDIQTGRMGGNMKNWTHLSKTK